MKRFLSVFISTMILFISMLTANAATHKEFTLNIYLKDIPTTVMGVQFYVEFDDTQLKLKDVECPKLPTAIINDNQNNDGMIRVNDSVLEGIDLSGEVVLLSATFDAYNDDISALDLDFDYAIECIYDLDMVDITQYSIYDIVNTNEAEGESPDYIESETQPQNNQIGQTEQTENGNETDAVEQERTSEISTDVSTLNNNNTVTERNEITNTSDSNISTDDETEAGSFLSFLYNNLIYVILVSVVVICLIVVVYIAFRKKK